MFFVTLGGWGWVRRVFSKSVLLRLVVVSFAQSLVPCVGLSEGLKLRFNLYSLNKDGEWEDVTRLETQCAYGGSYEDDKYLEKEEELKEMEREELRKEKELAMRPELEKKLQGLKDKRQQLNEELSEFEIMKLDWEIEDLEWDISELGK